MMKKSPIKDFGERGEYTMGVSNTNTFIQVNNLQKNEQYAKNDRSNRLDIMLKNHSKCSILNQMVI
jgi:hypothetical protein